MNFNYKSLINGLKNWLAFERSEDFCQDPDYSAAFSFDLNPKNLIQKQPISARECEMQSCLNVEADGRRASTLSNFGGATGHASSQMINTVPHIR